MNPIGIKDFLKKPIPKDNMYNIDDPFSTRVRQVEDEMLSKGMNNKDKAVEEPMLTAMTMNPNYIEPAGLRSRYGQYELLKMQAKQSALVNAIVNKRINQASPYFRPARYSERGDGFEVTFKNKSEKMTSQKENKLQEIEDFIWNTGKDKSFNRDKFSDFGAKIMRDRLTYDKINFELTYDKSKKLNRFKAVDASTIFLSRDKNGKPYKNDKDPIYRQIQNQQVVAEFTAKEMAWAVQNPRTELEAFRYGTPELEQVLDHLIYHRNTETFNARYFANGGTTRGLLQIKAGQQQSQSALDNFRREWSSFSGLAGAWKIPVITADDVKFINMNQSSKDMEFEKWLNYLINIVCSVFSIDPSEIGFPNRGGATGNSGNSINEASNKEKERSSKDSGLTPILRHIEATVNKYIVSQFGDEYIFRFRGGDSQTEKEFLEILKMEVELGATFDEIRKKMGYEGELKDGSGSMPASGAWVQHYGQIMQKEMMEDQKKQQRMQMMTEHTQGLNNQDSSGSSSGEVGKDGQVKGERNANSMPQAGIRDDEWKVEDE